MNDKLEARVLIVGVGGLGCPASLGLAKSGVTHLTLADPDTVDPSNLHRQLWHRGSDVGRPKVESAADRLRATFPAISIDRRAERVDANNAEALFRGHDLVIDATDGDEEKFLFSDAAVLTGTPLVHGGALRLAGQAMVIRKGGPCLRCLFEGAPDPDAGQSCAQAGVLGSIAGVIGALQAVLAVRELAARGGPTRGETEPLIRFDGATLAQRTVAVKKAADCPACGAAAGPITLGATRATA